MNINRRKVMTYAMLIFMVATLIYIFACEAAAQEIVIGVVADEPINLTLTPVGDLIVVTGTVGDEPVNIVTRTDGELIPRIHWIDFTVEPVEPEPEDSYED